MKALRLTSEEPFNRETAFRLRAIDYKGVEWNGGWVRPRLSELQGEYWELTGVAGGFSTISKQPEPSNSVELLYSPIPDIPFTESIITKVEVGGVEFGSRMSGGRHRFTVLGSDIEIFTEPESNELWLVASTSADLNHPYLENWLSEPLRALRGQLIFPRLVARNFTDGRAFVSLRRAPIQGRSLGGCASQFRTRSVREFWEFYSQYLTYIAKHRTKDGHPEFESNLLTRFHDEIIQAHLAGSQWVLALCVASAIEGIIKLGPDFVATAPDFTPKDLSLVESFLQNLKPINLRDRLGTMVAQLRMPSSTQYLAKLGDADDITAEHISAWKQIRNRVAHGNLFEPWGTEKEDAQLMKLVELLYRITARRIGHVRSQRDDKGNSR